MFRFIRNWRRKKILSQPTPDHWREILDEEFPQFEFLSPKDQKALLDHMKVFLAEKRFEGCGGLEVTESMRVSIAAQACLLLLNRDVDYYHEVKCIYIYPRAFTSTRKSSDASGIVTEEETVRLGEAWNSGQIVLSWEDVDRGAADIGDGRNVTLHEFAHQLDFEDNAANGAPILSHRSRYLSWARVLGEEFENLKRAKKRYKKTVLDKYGATNPAEFFAVATEAFFEKPHQLKKKHEDLYKELSEYYRQDPAQFMPTRKMPRKRRD